MLSFVSLAVRAERCFSTESKTAGVLIRGHTSFQWEMQSLTLSLKSRQPPACVHALGFQRRASPPKDRDLLLCFQTAGKDLPLDLLSLNGAYFLYNHLLI